MILHADAALLVADKPAGLPSVPGRPVELHDCLWQRVRAIYADALVVHRLDMATSRPGAVRARHRGPARARPRLRAARVDKRYEGGGGGTLEDESGEIDLPWPPTGRTGRASRSTASTASPR